MIKPTVNKKKRVPSNKLIVRNDINLEKWNIFTTQNIHKERTLTRTSRGLDGTPLEHKVTVGVFRNRSLTMTECKLFYLLIDLWEKQGKNPQGIISVSLNKLLSNLSKNEKKGTRYGSWNKTWLEEKIRTMVGVPIVFESAYKDKDDTYRREENVSLLSKVDIFDRKLSKANKKDEYARKSFFQIHPVILGSMLLKNIKPVRLDVILGLKKESSMILYRWLDLVLADKGLIEYNLTKLREDLDFGPERYDNFITTVREACEELEGKELTTGKLDYCRVEKNVGGTDWKLVVQKGKQVQLEFIEATKPADSKDDIDHTYYLSLWQSMNEPLKSQIKEQAEKIDREKSPNYRSKLSVEIEIVELMKMRDPAPAPGSKKGE